jgi:hypothetical protein
MAHACNSSYLGGLDQKDQGLRPAWISSFQDLIFKITRAKWPGGMGQAAERLLANVKQFRP